MTLFELQTTQREYDRDSENLVLLNQYLRGGGGARRRNVVILAVVGLALLAWMVWQIASGAAEPSARLLFPLLPLAAAAWLFLDLPTRRKRRAWRERLARNAQEPDVPLLVVFDENGYSFGREGEEPIAVDYDDVRRLIETEDDFFLTDQARPGAPRCVCLNKARFVDGTPEEFREFMEKIAQVGTEQIKLKPSK
ncbi:MAG TPA: hypothetical protein IAA56_03550 [Candidatus Galloscillospira excrementavium]|nr:hypothetical protein [Candidatus Galloscillospira excrementavium]